MQTFLPYPDFRMSAICLDQKRLGKQRVECIQILNAMDGGGWKNHPATVMWRGFVPALAAYGMAICKEWMERGYKDTCRWKLESHCIPEYLLPPWIGGPIHASHRSNLLRKMPEYYGHFGWTESNDLEYVWPVNFHTNGIPNFLLKSER